MAAKPISPHAVEAAKDNDYSATSMDCVPLCDSPRRKRLPAAGACLRRPLDKPVSAVRVLTGPH
jgi:hypothetical protein